MATLKKTENCHHNCYGKDDSPRAEEEDEEPDPGQHQTDDHVRQRENEPRTEVDACVSTVQPSQITKIDLHDGILGDEKWQDVTFWGSLSEANDHVTEKRHWSCMKYSATGNEYHHRFIYDFSMQAGSRVQLPSCTRVCTYFTVHNIFSSHVQNQN